MWDQDRMYFVSRKCEVIIKDVSPLQKTLNELYKDDGVKYYDILKQNEYKTLEDLMTYFLDICAINLFRSLL